MTQSPASASPTARETTVHIETGDSAAAALDRVLDSAGFLAGVERAREEAGKPPERFGVAVKANLINAPGADPALVERLLGTLRRHGYTSLALVDSRLARRGAVAAAQAAGYSGEGYRVVDLTDERVPFDYGSVLGEGSAGRTWLEADYRISFARAKAQRRTFYSGCLANLFGCLPEPDKFARYAGRGHEFYECCVLVADRLPVQFGVLDAWQGLDASRREAPRQTVEVLAGESAFALDWVAGEKMRLDPGLNPVLREALLRWGRAHVKRRGNLTAWSPWKNVRPATVVGLGLLDSLYSSAPLRGLAGRRLAEWTVQ